MFAQGNVLLFLHPVPLKFAVLEESFLMQFLDI